MSIRELQSVPLEDEVVQQDPVDVPGWWGRVEQLHDYLCEAGEVGFFEKVGFGDLQHQLERRYEELAASDLSAKEGKEIAQEWVSDAEALIASTIEKRKRDSTTPPESGEEPIDYETPEPEQPQFASQLEVASDWRWPWPAASGKKKAPRKKSDGAVLSTTTKRVVAAGAVIGGGIWVGRQFFGG